MLINATIWITAAFGVAATLAGQALAQEGYPTKPIRMIAPFPPGGSVDLIGRMVATTLSEMIGQQVIVENRSGASGNIGTEAAMRAAPDGYTLMVHTIPFVANAFLYSKLPYDPLNDFAPLMLVSASPSLLAVHPSMPVRTVKELIALAKSRPGQLNYGTAGPATNPHIAGELFNLLGKVNIVAVHYKGGGPALIATLSGEIDVTFTNFSETSEFVKAGRLRALGVSSAKRIAFMPTVPAIGEALPGFEFTTWQGLLAPRNTPRPVITFLNERLRKALTTPDQIKRFQERGLDTIASTPEEFAAHLKAEYQKWGRVIRERGMKAE